MRVFDCFTFFNELEVLDIRLNELDSVVDQFVLVEATKTYSGREKPLFFAQHRQRYSRFADRIIHVVVSDMPSPVNGNRWVPEKHQRRCIARGLSGCAPEDVILVSDADEIPRADVVCAVRDRLSRPGAANSLRELACERLTMLGDRCRSQTAKGLCRRAARMLTPRDRIVKCLHRHYEYCLNGFVTDDWKGTTFIRFSTLQKVVGTDAEAARLLQGVRHSVVSGGWHFSFMGDAARIAQKIHAFAHSEFDDERYTDAATIEARMARGENLFGKAGPRHDVEYVEIDDSWPHYVVRERSRLAQFIRPVAPNPRRGT